MAIYQNSIAWWIWAVFVTPFLRRSPSSPQHLLVRKLCNTALLMPTEVDGLAHCGRMGIAKQTIKRKKSTILLLEPRGV